MEFLINTHVLSELRKDAKANEGVKVSFNQVDGNQIYISVLTLGEIRQGIESMRCRDQSAAEALQKWLKQIETDVGGHVLPVTQEIADRWGYLNVPDKSPTVDGLLAATALVHELTVTV